MPSGEKMGIIVAIISGLLIIALAGVLLEAGARSRHVRPYLGMFLTALLVAGTGWFLDMLFHGVLYYFFLVARAIAALTAAALCLHLTVMIIRHFLTPGRP